MNDADRCPFLDRAGCRCLLHRDHGGVHGAAARWTAITRDDFETGSRADCAGCLTAAKLRDAALAMVEPA